MSSICGFCYFDGRPVLSEAGRAMMHKLAIYQADYVGAWHKGPVFLGCRVQRITPQSLREALPYHDEASGLTITADAIIDNRAEIFGKLGIRHCDRDDLPDSQLILQAYRKWGTDCVDHLLGDFAFVIWNEKRQDLFCAVDPTGTRTLYYYSSGGLFSFSTLIKPLFVLPEIHREYDETWIADFLAMPCLKHQLDPELTLYRNIYLLPAGHRLTVGIGGLKKEVYWEVRRQPELKLRSDAEYEEAFREVLGEAVRCRLRRIHSIGVMMSGGLDSTSVACMAARELVETGQRLQAFSSVPMHGYRDWLPPHAMADESAFIEAVREHAGNIDVTYCRSEGRHSLSDTGRLLAILEQPYKLVENLFWLDGIMGAAREGNIGVVLNGNAGNMTISWGFVLPYLLSLFRSGHWGRWLLESWDLAKSHPRPLRDLLGLLRMTLPMPKSLYHLRNRDRYKELQDDAPINPDFARHNSVQKRFRRYGYDPVYVTQLDSFTIRRNHFRSRDFSHLGVLTTKLSLAYGVAMRDPTMDKRVIEFCLSVPETQYIRGDRDRFLIRRAMAGLLPDKVRLNNTVRGQQSADWTQRLQACWAEVAGDIRNIGEREVERQYLDIPKIKDQFEKLNHSNGDAADMPRMSMLIRSLIFCRFLIEEENAF